MIVIDFGGGTLDVSLLYVQGGMFVTMAMAGNNKLGGQDVNNNLINFFREKIVQKFGEIDITSNDLQIIRDNVEMVKLSLTYNESVVFNIYLETISPLSGQRVNFKYILTRAEFNIINRKLFENVLKPVDRVLKDSETNIKSVDEIVLVGGSSRIPRVREIIADYFNKTPNTSINPDIAVAIGVAAQAGIMGNGWPLKVAAVEIQNHKLKKINVIDENDSEDL